MKVFLTVMLFAFTASVASAKCGNQYGGRMFDNTGAKVRVAKNTETKAPATNSRNREGGKRSN